MLRITEVKLPLDHPESDLQAAVLARLAIAPAELVGFTVFRRAYDARKSSNIFFIYTLDVEVKDEGAVLQRCHKDSHIGPAPDTSYRFVTQAAPDETRRPHRHRYRPLRPVRRADPGPDGLQAHHPGARQDRPRADQGNLGSVAPG